MHRTAILLLYLLLAPVAGAAPAAGDGVGAGGRFVRYDAFASAFVPARSVVVWLPEGYDAGSERYAVLYLHDGRNLFDPATSMGHEPWAVDARLAALLRAGTVRPTIVVGIDNAGADRWREYAPAAAVAALDPERRAQALRAAGGEPRSEEYLRFLVEELKPFVDAHFRTRPGRDDTFIMGSSMGGLISLYAISRYPDVFGGAGCLSTHWPLGPVDFKRAPGADPELDRVAAGYLDWLATHLPAPGDHRLYFDHGT
ncbi:MAG: alpha/beta hydrolase, partial [Proteobacteria bacterium]|nr:alpha/beta hydrolase [Pseudomonadota bacterium]